MDQNKIFETTETEIIEFTEKLNGMDCKTACAIARNDSWGDIAAAARSDMGNPKLSDLHDALSDFADKMQESENSWEG